MGILSVPPFFTYALPTSFLIILTALCKKTFKIHFSTRLDNLKLGFVDKKLSLLRTRVEEWGLIA